MSVFKNNNNNKIKEYMLKRKMDWNKVELEMSI